MKKFTIKLTASQFDLFCYSGFLLYKKLTKKLSNTNPSDEANNNDHSLSRVCMTMGEAMYSIHNQLERREFKDYCDDEAEYLYLKKEFFKQPKKISRVSELFPENQLKSIIPAKDDTMSESVESKDIISSPVTMQSENQISYEPGPVVEKIIKTDTDENEVFIQNNDVVNAE
ncbi:MAG: hypothetical protein EPN82_05805 [Bacteroidetes bacterium]|nr:MAG: hypothetical protein EPN82_05805 [Bacteroidota bacterium]